MRTKMLSSFFFALILLCSGCEFDSGAEVLETCSSNEAVAGQTSSHLNLTLDRDHPVAQSFKSSCLDGVISTITLKLQTVDAGVLSKVKVELFDQAEDGTLGAHIDDTLIENITSATLVEYTATFNYGSKLEPNKTYWFRIYNETANDVYVSTSGSSSGYANGGLFHTAPEWLESTTHRDVYFTAKVK